MMLRLVIILLPCFLIGEPIVSSCFAQAKEDKRAKQLEDEKRKLDGTKDPANRAKSFMKIGAITLSYVSEAAKANDFTKMKPFVEQYRQAVTAARDTMMRSGLDPHKKSGDFKAVEIALRKQIRNLQDIARLLTVDERQLVDETIDLVVKIRDEFIEALFGSVKAASADQRHPFSSGLSKNRFAYDDDRNYQHGV